MLRFLQMTGPFGLVLIIVTIVILALTVLTVRRISRRDRVGEPRFKNGLNGILFWGCLAAALGLLGQFSGLWRALAVIGKATEISPRLVAIGLMESFSTTIMGLVILVVSSLIWFALRAWSQGIGDRASG